MKVISLNKNPEKYGYPMEMDFKKSNFHGHQTACTIGIRRTDGTWDMLYTPGDTKEEKTKIAEDMLNDKSLLIVEQRLTQMENEVLVPKTIYFLPYYVADHSVYKPTINFDQISKSSNTNSDVKIEVLFVSEEGWYNRYVVFDLKVSGSYSLMDFISSLEQIIEDAAENNRHFWINTENEEYEEGDIILDFYDESGQKTFVGGNVEYFLDMVSSIRIIDIKTEIIEVK